MKILITGANGQDAAYLAENLLVDDSKIFVSTRNLNSEFFGFKYLNIYHRIKIVQLDLNNYQSVYKLLHDEKFDIIFHLAANSSVSNSNSDPLKTYESNIFPIINILESVRELKSKCRIFNASSSEIFGYPTSNPISINHILKPISPYGVTKKINHEFVDYYRENFKMFAVNGVLFNHESFLRDDNYFVKKLIRQAVKCHLGKANEIELGNLEIERDFGEAKNYVEAIKLMTLSSTPKNYIISTGKATKLADIVNTVLDYLKLDPKIIINSKNLFRIKEVELSYGDNSDIIKDLNWDPNTEFTSTLIGIINEELNFQSINQ